MNFDPIRRLCNFRHVSFIFFLPCTDHLEKVQNMHKNDTDCILWTKPPNTSDIELEYSIKFMYYNGAIINSTTSDLTEYCLVDITFDECKLLSVSVVAKAVCGDASSNLTWWNGTILSEFNIVDSIIELEQCLNIWDFFRTIRNTMEQIQCQFGHGGKWCNYRHLLHCEYINCCIQRRLKVTLGYHF